MPAMKWLGVFTVLESNRWKTCLKDLFTKANDCNGNNAGEFFAIVQMIIAVSDHLESSKILAPDDTQMEKLMKNLIVELTGGNDIHDFNTFVQNTFNAIGNIIEKFRLIAFSKKIWRIVLPTKILDGNDTLVCRSVFCLLSKTIDVMQQKKIQLSKSKVIEMMGPHEHFHTFELALHELQDPELRDIALKLVKKIDLII